MFAGGNIPGHALRAIAAAAICVAISTAPARAQFFDFLFGGKPAANAAPSRIQAGPVWRQQSATRQN